MMFSTYKEVDGKYLYLENSLTFNILGVGKDILKITFKKLITFNNVLHVANIGKNSVFDSLLSKISFKMVFEINKFILSKNDMFIKEKKEKKKCLYDGFVKMNIMTIIIAQVFTLFFKTKLKKNPKNSK
jgi:hypothetical protein